MRRLAVAVLVLASAGCSSSSPGNDAKPSGASSPGRLSVSAPGGAGGALETIPLGAGPQKVYTVQPQPAPGSCHYRYTADKEPLPDVKCTPGARNPAVTQATLKNTVCRPGGYTSTIRPPVSVTGQERTANARAYGYTDSLSDAEYDHFLSLSFGGDPNDRRNLWVEPPSPGHKPGTGTANPKDAVESKIHTALCSGRVTLDAAQHAVVTDWTTALRSLHLT
ncbi:hypothetical protein OG244_04390 [Streptomyces brevispora]